MKRIFTLFFVFGLILSLTACGSKQETPMDVITSEPVLETQAESTEGTEAAPYYGTWEVKDFQSGYVSAVSLEEAKAFVGKRITYQADVVSMDGETVLSGPVTYNVDAEPYREAEILENGKANLGEWWNGIDTVTGVTVESPEVFFGHSFFVVDSDTIWILYEGDWFLAKRA